MIAHVSVPVKNFKKAKKFYEKVLPTVGYKLNMKFDGAEGFMEGGHTSFWIVEKKKMIPIHVALIAPSKKAVHTFHAVALKIGGKDNGKPGPRPDYGPGYYASFVLDEDGNNIEAVCYS